MKAKHLGTLVCLSFLAVSCQAKESDSDAASAGSADASSGTCGTVISKESVLLLQVVSENSEKNADYILEPQDGATTNLLNDIAMRVGRACIKADFSKVDQPVLVKSVSMVRELQGFQK
jgi:hypothetical protein